MNDNCPVCRNRKFDKEGLDVAIQEVVPFVKKYVLQCKLDRPFPLRYKNLFASLCAYSQMLTYARAHGEVFNIYYSDNTHLVKIGKQLHEKFGHLVVRPASERDPNSPVRLVCEYNVET